MINHRVTPTQVQAAADGAVLHEGDAPLRWAVENLPRGTTVIEPGDYSLGRIERTEGGRFLARDAGTVRIVAEEGQGDAIAMMDGEAIAPVVFGGLRVECGYRSGWITLSERGPYRVSWLDCFFDGGWDHATDTGTPSKWGMIPHRWAGAAQRCVFANVQKEHGIYLHTPESDILLRDCVFMRCGRTGLQVVGRNAEAGFSPHRVTLDGCRFEDCGLNDGGSHITVQGVAEVAIKGCRSTIGLDEDFRAAWEARHPGRVFGTGHLVNWDENGRNDPTRAIWLHDFAAVTAEGCGSAPVVKVANADMLKLSGALVLESGRKDSPALERVGATDWSELRTLQLRGEVAVTA